MVNSKVYYLREKSFLKFSVCSTKEVIIVVTILWWLVTPPAVTHSCLNSVCNQDPHTPHIPVSGTSITSGEAGSSLNKKNNYCNCMKTFLYFPLCHSLNQKRWTVVKWLSYLKKLFMSSWTSYSMRDDRGIISMHFSRRTINSLPCSNSPRYWMRSVTLFMNSLKIKKSDLIQS